MDIHLSSRQRGIINMALGYLNSNLDAANDIINSDSEIVDQVFGIHLEQSISTEELQKLRENLSPD